MGMKDTLFERKEATITCEESMGDANEYRKLLEPLTKQEKTNEGRKTYAIYGQCNKLGHSKEHYHWNPNNKLKDKKEVAVNGVSAQPSGTKIMVTKEVTEKRTNLIPSFTNVSFAIALNTRFMTTLIRMQFKPCSRKR
jgi:hypothetical protein